MKLQVVFIVVTTTFATHTFGNVAGEETNKAGVTVTAQLENPKYVPTIDDLLSKNPASQQAVLVRAALEKWKQGSVVDGLRDVPELRPIMLKTFSEDSSYGRHMTSAAIFDMRQPYDRPLLNKKLIAEFVSELGIKDSLFHVLFADEDVSVRYDSLTLLMWLDGHRDKREVPIDNDGYHVWISRLLNTALTDY